MAILLKILTILLPALMLAGCSTPLHQKIPAPALPTFISASQLKTWQASGVFAVWTVHGNTTAFWQWQQDQSHYTLQLSGPLNSGAIHITGQPGTVTLETADGKKTVAGSPENLVLEATGWSLPVSFLKYWIRGIPVPGIPVRMIQDTVHRPRLLTQRDWHIQYTGYNSVHGFSLPERIMLTGPGIRIRIVIKQWQIPN